MRTLTAAVRRLPHSPGRCSKALAVRRDEAPEDGDGGLPVRAVVAGLAILYAAALAVGVFDGMPSPERPYGLGTVSGAVARERGTALPPGLLLCFHGPGGELMGFAAATAPQ